MKPTLALCLGCLAVACGGPPESEAPKGPKRHPVAVRAPFDLNCPREQLSYNRLDKKTMGVAGCGRRATYVRVCHDRIGDSWGNHVSTYVECSWMLNAAQ